MTHRLFVGFMPDGALRSRLATIADAIAPRLGEDCRRVRPSRYHVTLHFLGACPALPEAEIDAARSALDRVEAPSFRLTLDRAMSFPASHRRPCVLGCSETPPALHLCWQATRRAFEAGGFGPSLSRDFVPHLTVCYSAQGLPEPMAVPPVNIEARELQLMLSVPGEVDYRVLARRALVDAD